MKACLDHLASRHSTMINLRIDRVQALYDKLFPGNWSCPVVVVAGTNGKGSVLHTMDSIYRAADYKTARYTSPHLVDFRERLTISGQMLPEDRWLRVFSELHAIESSEVLTFFEFTTLAALMLAREESPDVLLLEIGLGARQDAVNVVPRDVSVITNIALDHQDWLGDTRDAIAYEKAGVIKSGVPVVLGELDAPCCIEEEVSRQGASCFAVGRDWSYCLGLENPNEMLFCADGGSALTCQIPQGIQPGNIGTALMAIETLSDQLSVTELQKQKGIKSVRVPGRQERLIENSVTYVLDVAHNPQAVESLVSSCVPKEKEGRVWCFFSALQGKDVGGMLAPFRGVNAHWMLFELEGQRAMPLADLESVFDANYQEYPYKSGDLKALWLQLHERMEPKDVILVFGSFQVVAAVMPHLKFGAEGENHE